VVEFTQICPNIFADGFVPVFKAAFWAISFPAEVPCFNKAPKVDQVEDPSVQLSVVNP
jgi:hypothetical protein